MVPRIRLFCLVGVLGVVLSSCVKQQTPQPGPEHFGTVEASLNGQPWKASNYYYHFHNNFIRLSFNLYRSEIRKHNLVIRNIPKSTGEYTMPAIYDPDDTVNVFQTKFTTYVADGDVLGNRYLLDSNLITPLLSITRYDSISEELEGHFELGFVIDTTVFPKWDASMPDTVIFTDGYFHTRLAGSGVEMK